jgi:hypothetical protein
MALWCTKVDVRYRVPQATVAKGWEDADIEARIARAETTLTARLLALYGATQITSWAATCPALMVQICADQAAVYVLTDWHGEAQMTEGSPGADLQARVDAAIERLYKRVDYLADSAGVLIAFAELGESLFESTTREHEPTFTLGHEVQDDTEPGSLDGY